MTTSYTYHRHPRIDERHRRGPVKIRDFVRTDHPNFWVRVNNRVGLRVTLIVGSMWCAYVFTAIALVALPQAVKLGSYYIIVWISSSFLQLVLLPVIIVGQNIQGRAADARSESTYQDAEAVLHEAAQIQAHLAAQDEVITHIADQLALVASGVPGLRGPGPVGTESSPGGTTSSSEPPS